MRLSRRLIAWSLYDWASSPVPTLHATFIFSVFFTTAVMPEGGTAAWAWMTSASALAVAIAAPLLGRFADRRGALKSCLAVATATGALATAGLWFVKPDASFAMLALGLSALSIFVMEISFVFYNAMLPSVARENEFGRASGLAWGLGYAGAIIALVIVLLLFVLPDHPAFGLGKENAGHIRITMCFAALWLCLFALPLFLVVPSPSATSSSTPFLASMKHSLQVAMTIPDMPRFLLARMLFADGLVTLFAFGGIYAATVFGFSQTMVLVFGIILNITAGVGAALGGMADDRFGSIRVMRGCLVALSALGLIAILAPGEAVFWAAGATLGLFIGPLQSSARAYVARRAPADQRASLFGLMMFSGKATSFIGPLLYGVLVTTTGSDRAGMAIVILLMLAGWLVMPRR
jgi:UMF1 family MFS transporter